MMLRSSSTPVLGSLLSSFSESPNHHLGSDPHHTHKHPTTPTHHHHNKPIFPLNSIPSPLARSALESSGSGFRRSISEGNLAGLDVKSDDHFSNSPFSRPPNCFHKRSTGSVLETIPSFSYHNKIRYEEEDGYDEDDDGDFDTESVIIFKNSTSDLESRDDGTKFSNAYKSSGFAEEQALDGDMFLARALGVENLDMGFGSAGGSGGGDFVQVAYGRDGGDGKRRGGAEEHYKNLVEENPGNPLFLRNYAQFLFETKKDLEKSEELYSRAILADPGDGEILSQYAKLIWQLHHDRDRALNYFERAVQAAPADSHVHAAYAHFLWEIEGDEEEQDEDNSLHSSGIFNSQFHDRVLAN